MPTSARRIPKVTVGLVILLSGCLGGLDDAGPKADGLLDGLLDLAPVCKDHEGPIVNASTGRIETVCNIRMATGGRPVNEPSIAVNPKNPLNLVAGANDYNMAVPACVPTMPPVPPVSCANLNPTVWTGVYVSKDGGETWRQSWIPGYPGGPVSPLTGQTAAGDAAIAFAPDGTAYYAGIAFKRTSVTAGSPTTGSPSVAVFEGPTLFIARSQDGGLTWDNIATPALGVGPLVTVSTPLRAASLAATLFNDKEFIAVGPNGEVYVTWTAYKFLPNDYDAPIQLIKSTDQGMSWSKPISLSRAKNNQASVPVVAPDGTLSVAWGEFDDDAEKKTKIVVRSSRDGGATFGPHVVVAEAKTLTPTHRTRVNSFPSLAVDASDSETRGRLTVTWAGNETGDPDVYLSQSADGGATWTAPLRVNQDPVGNGRAQFFPWAATDPNGVVHIVYYDGRDDPFNERLAAYVASTRDGVTIREQRVSDAPFHSDPDGFTGDNFLGDYLAIAASGEAVYPVWPDTRIATTGLGDTDLFTARLVRAPAAG